MTRSYKSIFALAVTFCMLLCFAPAVSAESASNGFAELSGNDYAAADFSPTKVEKGFWRLLTERQKRILRKAIRELKAQGASRKEIKALIKQYLKRWGIKLKKRYKKLKHFWRILTEEQRTELRQAIKELKEQGATKAEIRALIKKYLEEWGIIKIRP